MPWVPSLAWTGLRKCHLEMRAPNLVHAGLGECHLAPRPHCSQAQGLWIEQEKRQADVWDGGSLREYVVGEKGLPSPRPLSLLTVECMCQLGLLSGSEGAVDSRPSAQEDMAVH